MIEAKLDCHLLEIIHYIDISGIISKLVYFSILLYSIFVISRKAVKDLINPYGLQPRVIL